LRYGLWFTVIITVNRKENRNSGNIRKSGRICTFDRARLKPANIDILTTLHVWETYALEEDKRSRKKGIANDKFCCLKIDDLFKIVLVPGDIDDYEDDEEFLDDDE
jgi:hypothetical protein